MTTTTDQPTPQSGPAARGLPFEGFVAPAYAYPQLWRLMVGMVLVLTVWFLGVILIIVGSGLMVSVEARGDWQNQLEASITPTSVLVLMLTFIGLAVGPLLAAKLLHKRAFLTVIGATGRLLGDFLRTGGVVTVLALISVAVWTQSHDALPNVSLDIWLPFLPLALVGILLQTGAEEIAFRGYLMQQLAARFRSPWIWMGGSALLFGAVHFSTEVEGMNRWLVVLWAFGFGLVAADLTRVSGSIGAAFGFHFANNVLAILLLATDGSIAGLGLYRTPYTVSDTPFLTGFLPDAIMLIVAWAICRRLVRR